MFIRLISRLYQPSSPHSLANSHFRHCIARSYDRFLGPNLQLIFIFTFLILNFFRNRVFYQTFIYLQRALPTMLYFRASPICLKSEAAYMSSSQEIPQLFFPLGEGGFFSLSYNIRHTKSSRVNRRATVCGRR